MDGNRGAKGSIKDRLISILYRIRYAKKVKKEEEYEVSKKEKQVEYLQKLVNLKENENIDILDSKDKKELEKVKFTVNYKLTKDNQFNQIYDIEIINNDDKKNANSKEITTRKFMKKGIDIDDLNTEELDLNLSEIEQKTSELDEKVDLKKEIKKTKNEIVILDEVNKFVQKSKEVLEEISNEVESLKELSKNNKEDTEELEKRYKKLREKVDKLKAQYDAVKEKYDLSEFSILESIKLIDNIKDYKSRASLNEMDMMINVCKKEMTKIESVTIEYKETKKIGNNIEEIKEEQKGIKVRFHKSNEKLSKITNVEKDINDELEYQQQVIDDMYKEASHIEKYTQTDIVYNGYKGVFNSLLKIAGGILTLPFSGVNFFGIALGNTLINRGLKAMNRNNYPFELKKTTRFLYKDIAYKINEVKDKVEYTNLIISDNLLEIKKLKSNLKQYTEYKSIIPDYDNFLKKIDKMEEKLKLQQEKISKMDKKLEEEKKLNTEKIKKIENSNNH